YDRDGVLLLEFLHELFDAACGNRVKRRAGFVHQQHFRFGRNGAGNAQALLLPAGQRQTALLELVLHLVPDGSPMECLLDACGHIPLIAVQAQAKGHVVKDTHGKGIGLLEDHADVAAYDDGIDVRGVNVLAAEMYMPFETKATHQVIHAIETPQGGTLATARRANKGRDLALLNGNMAVADGEEFAVVQVVNLAVDNHLGRPITLYPGLTLRCLRSDTHDRAPFSSYASPGEDLSENINRQHEEDEN